MRNFHVAFSAVSAAIVAWAGTGCGGDENRTTADVGASAQPLSLGGADRHDGVVVFASEASALHTYSLDTRHGTLTRTSSVSVVQPVQYGAITSGARHLYVSLSDNATQHFVEAFSVDPATGALTQEGDLFVPPSARPINIDLDRHDRHLLMAHNLTQVVDALNLLRNGRLGTLVTQPGPTPTGNFAHQVRVHPSDRYVFTCARGTDASGTTPEQPGQITVWNYDDGVLTSRLVVPPPADGIGPRHLDFGPGGDHVYVAAERGNRLLTYTFRGGTLALADNESSLASTVVPSSAQRAGAIHVHPNGRWLYLTNRNTTTRTQTIDGAPTVIFDGGVNEVALFAIDGHPSHPTRLGGFDVHGFEPRTFTIDPTQRFIIVANQKAMTVLGDDGKAHAVNPNLVVFRIEKDGSLVFLHSYDLGSETLWVDSARLGEAD